MRAEALLRVLDRDGRRLRQSCHQLVPGDGSERRMDDSLKTIKAGMVVAEAKTVRGGTQRVPTVVEVYTSDAVITLTRGGGSWSAEYEETSMGRPLIGTQAHCATLERPFGNSRITEGPSWHHRDAIRQRARMEVAVESATLPRVAPRNGQARDERGQQVRRLDGRGQRDDEGRRRGLPDGMAVRAAADGPAQRVLPPARVPDVSVTDVPVSFFGVSNDNPSSSTP